MNRIKNLLLSMDPVYVARCYLISALYVGFIIFGLIAVEDLSLNNRILQFFIISAILFPLAKLGFDDLWNFILGDNIIILPLFGSLLSKFIVNYFILALSIVIAPITLIILFVADIYLEWREKRSQNSEMK